MSNPSLATHPDNGDGRWHGRPRRSTHRWATGLGVLAIAAVLAGPGVAQARFSAPRNISFAGEDASGAQVASDDRGHSLFTWIGTDSTMSRVQARAMSAGGVRGPVQTIATGGIDKVCCSEVVMDRDGDALVTWLRSDGTGDVLLARSRHSNGVLGPVHQISAPGHGVQAYEVAVNARGSAAVVWTEYVGPRYDMRLEARVIAPGGNLGPIRHVTRRWRGIYAVDVAVDPHGNALIAWAGDVDRSHRLVEARSLSAQGVLRPVRRVSHLGHRSSIVLVAVDTHGKALVTWTSSRSVRTRRWTATGGLGRVLVVSPRGQDASVSDVAIDRTGTALFAWLSYDRNAVRDWVVARRLTRSGTLGRVKTLFRSGARWAGDPDIAVDRDGNAVFTWEIDNEEPRYTQYWVQARALSARGVIRPLRTLAALGHDPSTPHVAMDTGGDAIVTWAERSGGVLRVKASRGP
jgi:hypothetical protein